MHLCYGCLGTRAYIETVIPDGYRNFDIHQFNGRSKDGSHLVQQNLIVQAKKKIIQYCWGDIDIDIDMYSQMELDRMSIMDKKKRRKGLIQLFSQIQ